jgi:hemerythrin-like domain-containing protein
MDADYGPVAVMLRDHQQFRDCINLIEESLDEGKEGHVKRWGATGNFIEGLRFHIHKENNILYPMGEDILSLEDENRLMEMFDDAEITLGGVATEEHYRMVAQSLEKQVLAAFDRVAEAEAE